MKIITAPSRSTLAGLGLEPAAGLGESVSDCERRGSMLAWHLNHWAVAQTGGTPDFPWLGRVSTIARHSLSEFRHRIDMLEGAVSQSGGDGEPVFCGWEFLLTAGLWTSSRGAFEFHLVHAGFEKELRNLAEESGLPPRLAEPLLRTWLSKLYRLSSAGCGIFLSSLHEGDPVSKTPGDLLALERHTEDLAETEMNAADPLPHGTWRLKKGSWEIAATASDLEMTDALQRLANPAYDMDVPALAFGRDFEQPAAPVSLRAYREVRTVELRGIDRVNKDRALSAAGQKRGAKSKPSFFRDLLKRIFLRKRSR